MGNEFMRWRRRFSSVRMQAGDAVGGGGDEGGDGDGVE